MQRYLKMKTDYKELQFKASEKAIHLTSKWMLPFAISLLAFFIVWKLGTWLTPSCEASQDAWPSQAQESYDIPLPTDTMVSSEAPPFAETPLVDEEVYRTQQFTIQSGKSLANYFKKAGIDPQDLAYLLKTKHGTNLKRIYPGQILTLESSPHGKLESLALQIDPLTTLTMLRTDEKAFTSSLDEKPIEKRVAFSGGKILNSFYTAGRHAKLDDALIMELANIFAYDIDFAQDIKPNDHFKVLFEEHFANGDKIANGPIVAAEFHNNGKKYCAIRFTESDGKSRYFTPEGDSLHKAFLRTPVKYTRISAHFNPKRYHPVLHKIRAHRGVDYAAPTGTPIKAAGNGKVAFVGTKGGYGNAIILQHGPKYTTLYGHLSKFAKNLKAGQSIKQGDIIGYVGSTGLATGPHLHYEFRINGEHHNPLTVALPKAEGVAKHHRSSFLAHAGELLSLMDTHDRIFLAQNEY